MTRIAHLTDLHLLEARHALRPACERLRLSFLSFGRRLDADGRRARLVSGVHRALRARADHIVLTGDLTEDGTDAQFEALAEALHDCSVDPDRVTLIPGNHDAYTDPQAFGRALDGPLRAFRRTSGPCTATVLDEAVVVPVSTAMGQPVTRSAGAVSERDLAKIDALAGAPTLRHKAVVVAMHHPPTPAAIPGAQWVDGLQNHRAVRAPIERREHVHVLHGHTHRETDRPLGAIDRSRVFCAGAVVDASDPLRLYEAEGGRLVPCELSPEAAPTRATRAVAVRAPAPCPA